MSRFKGTLIALFAIALCAAGKSAWCAQDDEDITVEVLPASVEFRDRRAVPVIVVVHNTSGREVRNLRISWFTDARATIGPEVTTIEQLVPDNEVAWQLVITPGDDGPVAGTVHVRLDYALKAAQDAAATQRVLLSSISLTQANPATLDDLIKPEIKTDLVFLTEQSPGQLYLIIANKHDSAVGIKPFTPLGPDFVTIDGLQKEETVGPHQQRTLDFKVLAHERVRPGKHLVVFEVPVAWRSGGTNFEGSFTLSQEVEVGVLGESTILKLLGLPSFLLLPGFLFVTMIGLFWKLQFKDAKPFALKVATAEFWLVTITLSILSVIVYQKIAGHNYLESYGLNDLVRIWGGAIVSGLAAYILIVLGMRLSENLRAGYIARRTPALGDDPLTILAKLGRLDMSVSVRTALVGTEGNQKKAFLLQPLDENRETTWIGPRIKFRWKDTDTEDREKITKLLQKPEDAQLSQLAKLFQQAKGQVTLSWGESGSLKGPEETKTAELNLEGDEDSLLEAS